MKCKSSDRKLKRWPQILRARMARRMYYGTLFGQNEIGMIHDCIWGSTLASEFEIPLTV
jgi:hypothetical protein